MPATCRADASSSIPDRRAQSGKRGTSGAGRAAAGTVMMMGGESGSYCGPVAHPAANVNMATALAHGAARRHRAPRVEESRPSRISQCWLAVRAAVRHEPDSGSHRSRENSPRPAAPDSSSCAQAPRALCAASMHASGKRERRHACRFSMRRPGRRRSADRSPAVPRCAAEFPRPSALQPGAVPRSQSCGLPKRPQIPLAPIKGMRIVPLSVTVQGFAAARAR
jgi:hypothetical protein